MRVTAIVTPFLSIFLLLESSKGLFISLRLGYKNQVFLLLKKHITLLL